MVDDLEAEMLVERLSSSAYLGCELCDPKFLGSIMDPLHELPANAKAVGGGCNEEMINVAILLNFGIRDDFAVALDHKWSNALNATGPKGRIELARCPRVNLGLTVVADRNIMDRRFEDAPEVGFVAGTKSS